VGGWVRERAPWHSQSKWMEPDSTGGNKSSAAAGGQTGVSQLNPPGARNLDVSVGTGKSTRSEMGEGPAVPTMEPDVEDTQGFDTFSAAVRGSTVHAGDKVGDGCMCVCASAVCVRVRGRAFSGEVVE
jgi:hypothetical protein